MPSPFPGMDPYLERPGRWSEFHNDLVTDIKRLLRPALPAGYEARGEVDLFVHEPPASERVLFARADDATVALEAAPKSAPRTATGATTQPALRTRVEPLAEPEQHRYIEIRTKDGRQVVTVIELLSPANKSSDRKQYLGKQKRLAQAGVHLLQIDLLRGGGPRLLPGHVPPHHYNALLNRAGEDEVDIWVWSVRDSLPTLPVPLDAGLEDVPLDLQRCVAYAYDMNGYDTSLYSLPPAPPLSPEDQDWADKVLIDAGIQPPLP